MDGKQINDYTVAHQPVPLAGNWMQEIDVACCALLEIGIRQLQVHRIHYLTTVVPSRPRRTKEDHVRVMLGLASIGYGR